MRLNKYIRNPNGVGKTSIYFTIVWFGKRLIYQTGESINKTDWNNKKFEPKQNAENANLIGRLNKKEQKVRDAFEKLEVEIGIENITPQLLKDKINGKEKIKNVFVKKEEKISITDFFQVLIDDSKSGKRLSDKRLLIKKDSIKPYCSTMQAFTNFEKYVGKKHYLNKLDQSVIDDFETYLVEVKMLALNTKSKYLQIFMLMASYACKKKIITKETFSELEINNDREESDNPYLSEAEINDLMNYNNPNSPKLVFIKDMFVLACWSALRHSDFSKLNQKNFIENRIRTIQQKVDERIVIPIHPTVRIILDKYPNGWPYKIPSSQKFNKYLLEITKTIPSLQTEFEKRTTRAYKVETVVYKKSELITTHSARRSFSTNEFLNGTNESIIRAITGHKNEATFRSYVKATKDEKANLLEKEWEKRYKTKL